MPNQQETSKLVSDLATIKRKKERLTEKENAIRAVLKTLRIGEYHGGREGESVTIYRISSLILSPNVLHDAVPEDQFLRMVTVHLESAKKILGIEKVRELANTKTSKRIRLNAA